MNEPAGNLAEVFSSVQGEGLAIGLRQLFIRFAGCNLRCCYCDTPQALEPLLTFRWERPWASGRFREQPNPIAAPELVERLEPAFAGPREHHSIALTGGEPLLQIEFLKALLDGLAPLDVPLYLETNGTLPEALRRVVDRFWMVAMDVKLPSAGGQEPRWEEHRAFLEVLKGHRFFVKVVITPGTRPEDVERLEELLAGRADVPVVLQPATALKPEAAKKVPLKLLLRLQARLARAFNDVRVIPQIHPVLGLR